MSAIFKKTSKFEPALKACCSKEAYEN